MALEMLALVLGLQALAEVADAGDLQQLGDGFRGTLLQNDAFA
jgi:hypothetical protein